MRRVETFHFEICDVGVNPFDDGWHIEFNLHIDYASGGRTTKDESHDLVLKVQEVVVQFLVVEQEQGTSNRRQSE